jgi:serine/threonine-protein kinase
LREAASLSAAELRAALVRPQSDAAPEAPMRRFTRTAAWILGVVSVVAIGEAVALVFMASHIEPPVLVQPTPAPSEDRPVTDPLSLNIASPLPGPSSQAVATPAPPVRADRTAQSSPAATGRVSLNATPWAEVIIDGRDIGQTPIANFSLPAGKHEIVFRHPQLGERRQTITIQPGALVRVAESFQ